MDPKEPKAELVNVDALLLHPQNPRRGDIEAIADSIRANGFIGALRVQTSTSYVIGGNHTLQAAQLLGITRVPKPDECEKIELPGKHRYLMPLDRAMRKKVEPLRLKHPQPKTQ